MIKRIYLFLHNHLAAVIRVWMLLLIPCALSKHFAAWMLTANIAVWLIMLQGEHKKWWREEK
jgi:hypothetical protein